MIFCLKLSSEIVYILFLIVPWSTEQKKTKLQFLEI